MLAVYNLLCAAGIDEATNCEGRTRMPTGTSLLETTAELSHELIRLREVMERTGAQMAARRRHDLDKAAYVVLFHLATDGPQRSGALAESMFTDPSTISRHVAQLVDRGLVARTADPDDGRATVLAVTELGQQAAAAVRRHRGRLTQVVVEDWDADDTATLTRLLTRFVDDLERRRPALLADSSFDADAPSHRSPAPGDPA